MATPTARYVSRCLASIKEHNAAINAMTHLAPASQLVASADEAGERWKQGRQRSALDGFPIAIKANICTTDLPTTCGSKMLERFTSPFDATVVSLLRKSGALIVGKTNMDEFGMGSANLHSVHGPTYNPLSAGSANDRSTAVVAGGSSGGSAAAVASGMCFAALGSDTGGSVRTPAAYTGVIGFKPSYGRLSRFGLVAYASSLDTIGILARDVDAVRTVYEILAQPDQNDPTSLAHSTSKPSHGRRFSSGNLTGLRVGVPQEYHVENLHPAVLAAWSAAAARLSELGATVVPISLPSTRHALPAYYVIAPAEASSNLAKYDGIRYGHRSSDPPEKGAPLYSATRTEAFGAEVVRRIMLGTFVLQASSYTSYYQQAQKLRRLVQRDFDRVFRLLNPLHPTPTLHDSVASGADEATRVDILLTPSATSPAPRAADLAAKTRAAPVAECLADVMTVPASLAGLPALALPFGEPAQGGLPVGVQLLGQFGDDETVLEVADLLIQRHTAAGANSF
ncbi:Trimeric GatFAB AmidoTransferase(AdT) complex subunit [Geranomyces variabilis]|uniref:Glutamyl-tRNA(Gln) amidotransferase subunit A, mitochondrial n=1 Tax=Geranomyces variabilis TaxID=109894 RepID=A0AAD5TKI0_9FUNG|nr:Trimeric GatFAB AmidoTransferase(AdT) complex subunit [Geranomyces variabilis]